MINLQRPARKEGSQLLLVDSSVLPEVFLRVVEAKRMLAVGQVRSLSEAAKAAGISRSALYKYKDCVFVHNEALDDQVITLSARLEDRPGVLSGLLNTLSEQQGNILTVNHSREDRDSEVGACIVSLVLETRNSDHVAAIKLALTDAGYPLLHNS